MKIDVDIPDGKSGNWSVETFTITEEEAKFNNMRSLFSSSTRYVHPGTYKRLKINNDVMMSNTPAEIDDCCHFINIAKGSILINGLGLGVVIKALLNKPDVIDITVIELEKDVIDLIAPYYNDERLTIINDDAFTYTPPKNKKYDYVWHDIWLNICADNLKEMEKLHRKYGKKCGRHNYWFKDVCLYYRQQSKRRFY
jgi:16S rRNA A1518/A1519 N6-dimethyltransferase RsmA/KsgA/DIM1 with predicted DNA glycosylase/AP lyase activity